MAMLHHFHFLFLSLVAALCLSSMKAAADTGTATFYNPPYIPSACYGNQDHGVMIAAASDAFWNNGAICGTSYKVMCTGATNPVPHPCKGSGTVVVKIVDHCPAGCAGTIDLSREAFASIADPVAGKIKVSYDRV